MITQKTIHSAVLTVLLFASTLFSSPVFAEENPQGFGSGLDAIKNIASENKLAADDRSSKDILQTLIKWFMSIIATVALISLLYAGFMYITSQGDENQLEKAKMLMLHSIIGIIIIGLSAIIVNVVINVVGQG